MLEYLSVPLSWKQICHIRKFGGVEIITKDLSKLSWRMFFETLLLWPFITGMFLFFVSIKEIPPWWILFPITIYLGVEAFTRIPSLLRYRSYNKKGQKTEIIDTTFLSPIFLWFYLKNKPIERYWLLFWKSFFTILLMLDGGYLILVLMIPLILSDVLIPEFRKVILGRLKEIDPEWEYHERMNIHA